MKLFALLLFQILRLASTKNTNLTDEINLADKISDNLVEESLESIGDGSEFFIDNGFRCRLTPFKNTHQCFDIDECKLYSNLCDSKAKCVNTYGSYRCICEKGSFGSGKPGECFDGKFCSGKICRWNGECYYDQNLGHRCRCMLDCQNGGYCVMNPYKYECKCVGNYTGDLCDISSN
jgi:hypothetical protein